MSSALGTLSFIAMIAWTVVVTVAQSLSGMGDGAASIQTGLAFGYAGSLYLFLVFLSCLPFVRGGSLITVGIIAHVILIIFAIYLIATSGVGGLVLLVPFAAFAAGWVQLFKSKIRA